MSKFYHLPQNQTTIDFFWRRSMIQEVWKKTENPLVVEMDISFTRHISCWRRVCGTRTDSGEPKLSVWRRYWWTQSTRRSDRWRMWRGKSLWRGNDTIVPTVDIWKELGHHSSVPSLQPYSPCHPRHVSKNTIFQPIVIDPYYVNLATTLEDFLGPHDKWSTLSNVEKQEGFENCLLTREGGITYLNDNDMIV